MAENSKNALHGTQLTGLRPKQTFLSRLSKKLQILHGTTHGSTQEPFRGYNIPPVSISDQKQQQRINAVDLDMRDISRTVTLI